MRAFAVDRPLWTAEKGRSDLEVRLTLVGVIPGVYGVELGANASRARASPRDSHAVEGSARPSLSRQPTMTTTSVRGP